MFLGPKEFTYKGRNYFYSGHTQQYKTSKVDWLEARNICREYCMDLVSIETQEENNLIFRLIQQSEYFEYYYLLQAKRRFFIIINIIDVVCDKTLQLYNS